MSLTCIERRRLLDVLGYLAIPFPAATNYTRTFKQNTNEMNCHDTVNIASKNENCITPTVRQLCREKIMTVCDTNYPADFHDL